MVLCPLVHVAIQEYSVGVSMEGFLIDTYQEMISTVLWFMCINVFSGSSDCLVTTEVSASASGGKTMVSSY